MTISKKRAKRKKKLLSYLQRLGRTVLLTEIHETGHFLLSKSDFLTTESGERDVSDLVVSSHCLR